MTCAIVIPYFQRKDGVLRRALASVFAQTFQDFRVIVVDDASPHPAEEELASLPTAQREKIVVIRQPNAGPGGARNTGMDAVGEAEFVAFLDSDDVWDPGHLERAALAIFEHRADIYIAAISGDDEFHYHSDFEGVLNPDTEQIPQGDQGFYIIENLAWRMIEDWSFLHLSCLAMSPEIFKKVRFEPKLRLAGEDVLFFHDCLSQSRRTILSPASGAVRGLGDNLFHGVSTTADNYIRQQAFILQMFDMMSKRQGVRGEYRALLAKRKRDVRVEVMWGQRNRLREGKSLQLGHLTALLMKDPSMPASVLKYMMCKWMKKKRLDQGDAAASS